MTAQAAAVLRAAEMIDDAPGLSWIALAEANATGAHVTRRLRELGYRDFVGIVGRDTSGAGVWNVQRSPRWWPSRRRCVELAKTATGTRRERLLLGMWLPDSHAPQQR